MPLPGSRHKKKNKKKDAPPRTPRTPSAAPVGTPGTPVGLREAVFDVAPAPAKTSGFSHDLLDFAHDVVQVNPGDIAACGLHPDDCVVVALEDDGAPLGVSRVWPSSPVAAGVVRLGRHLFQQRPETFTAGCRVKLRSLGPSWSILSVSPTAPSVKLEALDGVLPPSNDFAVHMARSALRRRVLVPGCLCTVSCRGQNRTFRVTATCGGPLEPFIVSDTTDIGFADSGAPAASLAPPPSAAPLSSLGGLDAEVAVMRRLVSLPLLHPKVFSDSGLQPYKGVLLYGPPGTGKTSLAQAVAADLGVSFLAINGPEVMTRFVGGSEEKVRQVFRDAAAAAPAIVFIDEVDALCPRREDASEVESRIVGTLLAIMDGMNPQERVVVIGATNRPNAMDAALRRPGRFDREVEVGVPTAAGRLEILRKAITPYPHSATDDDLARVAAATHGYVGADLVSLCKEAALSALRRTMSEAPASAPPPVVTPADLDHGVGATFPSGLREVIVDVPKVHWADIGGQDDAKQALKEAVEWPLQHPDAFARMGIRPPKGVLLYGPPGCSKTMMAKALATEGGMNFIAIKGPELLSKWVGESERAVQDVFRKARVSSPCVVFFDEIDALAVTRGAGGESSGGVQTRVVSQLLHELDGISALKQVVVVAATNRPDLLDPAFTRPGRIDRMLYIGPPDSASRAQILQIQLARVPHAGDVNLAGLVARTDGYSGAECVAVVKEAALAALSENLDSEVVCDRHFAVALAAMEPQITADMLEFYASFKAAK